MIFNHILFSKSFSPPYRLGQAAAMAVKWKKHRDFTLLLRTRLALS